MYWLVIIFFAALLAIIVMIGRKLMLLRSGEINVTHAGEFIESEYIDEIKDATIQNIKKHSYTGVVVMVRLYVKFTNFLKSQWENLKTRVDNAYEKFLSTESGETREVSKFLKMVSDYKRKLREIKHKVKKEEEKNL